MLPKDLPRVSLRGTSWHWPDAAHRDIRTEACTLRLSSITALGSPTATALLQSLIEAQQHHGTRVTRCNSSTAVFKFLIIILFRHLLIYIIQEFCSIEARVFQWNFGRYWNFSTLFEFTSYLLSWLLCMPSRSAQLGSNGFLIKNFSGSTQGICH